MMSVFCNIEAAVVDKRRLEQLKINDDRVKKSTLIQENGICEASSLKNRMIII